jgi:hypothetical protein
VDTAGLWERRAAVNRRGVARTAVAGDDRHRRLRIPLKAVFGRLLPARRDEFGLRLESSAFVAAFGGVLTFVRLLRRINGRRASASISLRIV